MTAVAIRHFDVLDFVDNSKALGADEKLNIKLDKLNKPLKLQQAMPK